MSDNKLKTYDLKDAELSIGGVPITGFAEDDEFEFEPPEHRRAREVAEAFEAKAGKQIASIMNDLARVDMSELGRKYGNGYVTVTIKLDKPASPFTRRERFSYRNALTGAKFVATVVNWPLPLFLYEDVDESRVKTYTEPPND